MPISSPESKLDQQVFGDIRKVPAQLLEGADAVVHLAAVSNDPMGKYEQVTIDVNHQSSIELAKKAKAAGVNSFVFASCSMYGAASDGAKTGGVRTEPAYGLCPVQGIYGTRPETLADNNFTVTRLRFATACGMSDRLRLDLVLNDFVAGAVSSGQISILSDGTPWRPLINVKDMAIAIEWAITRPASNGGQFLAVNTGSNEWNYQVKELAEAVAGVIPGVKVSVNADAPPDKRSYRVNFDLYQKLAPDHQPQRKLMDTIKELKESLDEMGFSDGNFRNSRLMRLKVLNDLQEKTLIDNQLSWIQGK